MSDSRGADEAQKKLQQERIAEDNKRKEEEARIRRIDTANAQRDFQRGLRSTWTLIDRKDDRYKDIGTDSFGLSNIADLELKPGLYEKTPGDKHPVLIEDKGNGVIGVRPVPGTSPARFNEDWGKCLDILSDHGVKSITISLKDPNKPGDVAYIKKMMKLAEERGMSVKLDASVKSYLNGPHSIFDGFITASDRKEIYDTEMDLEKNKVRNDLITRSSSKRMFDIHKDRVEALSKLKGIALISTTTEPKVGDIDKLLPAGANMAYVRTGDKLFYLDKTKQASTEIPISATDLAKFDQDLRTADLKKDGGSRMLSDQDLEKMKAVHDPKADLDAAKTAEYQEAVFGSGNKELKGDQAIEAIEKQLDALNKELNTLTAAKTEIKDNQEAIKSVLANPAQLETMEANALKTRMQRFSEFITRSESMQDPKVALNEIEALNKRGKPSRENLLNSLDSKLADIALRMDVLKKKADEELKGTKDALLKAKNEAPAPQGPAREAQEKKIEGLAKKIEGLEKKMVDGEAKLKTEKEDVEKQRKIHQGWPDEVKKAKEEAAKKFEREKQDPSLRAPRSKS